MERQVVTGEFLMENESDSTVETWMSYNMSNERLTSIRNKNNTMALLYNEYYSPSANMLLTIR